MKHHLEQHLDSTTVQQNTRRGPRGAAPLSHLDRSTSGFHLD